MARLNISVPDQIYERLDRLRDRVNASRVCSVALDRELDAVEGLTIPVADQRITQLVERLQGRQDLWYQRGRHDGEVWAVEVAGLKELRQIGEAWSDDGTYDLERHELPCSFEPFAMIYKWELQDIWDTRSWEWLRDHLAARLDVPASQIGLGTGEGRGYLLRRLGYRDEDSNAAVRAFEQDHGLRPDAYLGPSGWAALINAYLERAAAGELLEPGESRPPETWPPVDAEAFRNAHARFERQWLKTSYLRGWHTAVKDVWRLAKPRLQLQWTVDEG